MSKDIVSMIQKKIQVKDISIPLLLEKAVITHNEFKTLMNSDDDSIALPMAMWLANCIRIYWE